MPQASRQRGSLHMVRVSYHSINGYQFHGDPYAKWRNLARLCRIERGTRQLNGFSHEENLRREAQVYDLSFPSSRESSLHADRFGHFVQCDRCTHWREFKEYIHTSAVELSSKICIRTCKSPLSFAGEMVGPHEAYRYRTSRLSFCDRRRSWRQYVQNKQISKHVTATLHMPARANAYKHTQP